MCVGLCGGLCLCVECKQEKEASVQGPGAGVPEQCELPNTGAGTERSPLQEKHMLLTPGPSLQPWNLIIIIFFVSLNFLFVFFQLSEIY